MRWVNLDLPPPPGPPTVTVPTLGMHGDQMGGQCELPDSTMGSTVGACGKLPECSIQAPQPGQTTYPLTCSGEPLHA
jgi:hypothetical protein